IDWDEGKSRPCRRRNAGIETRGFVRLLGGVEPGVEPRQAERAAHGERERSDPAEAWSILQRPQEKDERGRRPERDIVGEGVELRPEAALRPKKPRDPAVDPIEHARKH